MAADRQIRATEIQFPNRWTVGWPAAQFMIGDDVLTARSLAMPRRIPAFSVSKDAVGDIAVDHHVRVFLPMLHWHRWIQVTFEQAATNFAGVKVMLPRRTKAIDELRARGYSVTDRTDRAGSGPA